jgi:uncharacterized protein (TIGR03083 family)
MRLDGLASAFREQRNAIADWLDDLPEAAFAEPSALPGWDVRTLLGHLVMVGAGAATVLGTRDAGPAVPVAEYVQRYRRDVAAIEQRTRDVAADQTPSELLNALRDKAGLDVEGLAPTTVLAGPRGPIRADDWLATRVLDLVVHADDLSRSRPDRPAVPFVRPALAAATRLRS